MHPLKPSWNEDSKSLLQRTNYNSQIEVYVLRKSLHINVVIDQEIPIKDYSSLLGVN